MGGRVPERGAWGREGAQGQGRERVTWANESRQDGARGPGREGNSRGQGKGGGAHPQPEVQAVRCIPPGIQHMLAHHAHYHHKPIYDIDPDMGDLIPPKPPQPPRQPPPHLHGDVPHDPAPAAREPRTDPARFAAAPAAPGSGADPARLAREPRAELARGAVGAPRPAVARNDWVRDWDAIPDPLGGDPLPLVMKVYGWLNWATSGTTRGLRSRPFNAVLLRRDGRNREVAPVGWVALDDHLRVLRAVIRAGWPDLGLERPAFPEGGTMLRVTDAEANIWLPRALRTALSHRRYRLCSPSPHASGNAHCGQTWRQWPDARQAGPRTPGSEHRGLEADRRPAPPPPAGPGPPTLSAPPPPPSAQQDIRRTSVTPDPGDREGRGHAGGDAARWACADGAGHADARGKGVPLTR